MKHFKYIFISLITLLILSLCSCDMLQNLPGTEPEKEAPVVTGIQVGQVPTKRFYDIYLNEAFDATGLIVNLVYSDGSVEQTTKFSLKIPNGDYLIQGYKFTTEDLGNLNISVICQIGDNTFEASFPITVIDTTPVPPDDSGDPENPEDPEDPENPQETDPYEGLPLDQKHTGFMAHKNTTKYVKGSTINREDLRVLIEDGYGYCHDVTDYSIKIIDKKTEKPLDSIKNLPLGDFTVILSYNDGIKEWTTDYEITVTNPVEIDEFSYSTNNGSVVIGGFKGKDISNSSVIQEQTIDYDAPYETVYSQPSDFEYEFIEGSQTDIRILGVKAQRMKIITDLTIPSKIGDYNVKEVSCDIGLYDDKDNQDLNGNTVVMGTIVRNLIIEEGIEHFTLGTFFTSWGSYQHYQNFLKWGFPYLKKLVLPKGFSLDMQMSITHIGLIYYNINCEHLEELVLPSDLTEIYFDVSSKKLKEFNIPSSVTYIKGSIDVPVKKLIIPESVKKLVSQNISLPEAEEFIFEGETDVSPVYWDFPKIEELTFTGDIETFSPFIKSCSSLKKIIFTKNASITKAIFENQTLEEVEVDLPNKDTVEINGFDNCSKINKISINVANNANLVIGGFRNCTSLESLEIPANVERVVISGFEGCKNLKEFKYQKEPMITQEGNFGTNEDKISEDMLWYSCEIYSDAFKDTGFKEFTFEKGLVYEIGKEAFAGCPIEKLNFDKDCYVSSSGDNPFGTNNLIKEIDMTKAFFVSLDFSNCIALTTLKIGNCAYLDGKLDNCINLATISLGEEGYFKPYSMQNCSNLKGDISFRGIWITYFKDYGEYYKAHYYYELNPEALKGCSSLKNISFTDCLIPSYLFGKEGCDYSFTIEMDNSEIDDYAFYKCRGLNAIDIEFNQYERPNSIFEECTGLKQVRITGNLGRDCFKNCTALEKVIFTNSYLIGERCFYNCTSLKTIEMDEDRSFYGTFEPMCFYNCKKLSSFKFSEACTFKEKCFDNCEPMINIMKSNGIDTNDVKWLPILTNTSLCYVCDDLVLTLKLNNLARVRIKNLTIDNTVYSFIPTSFAENNTTLQTVTLDSDIEAKSFKSCSSLKTVTLGDTTFHSVKADSFADCPKLTKIIVPEEYYEQYKSSARWKNYWDLICTE